MKPINIITKIVNIQKNHATNIQFMYEYAIRKLNFVRS